MTVKWNEDLMPQLRQAAMRGVVGWIGIVEQRAVDLIMSPPKTGRVYRRRGVEHQASAGGEAPANWTGRLVNSRRIVLFESTLRARLLFSTDYAAFLELGTRKMEPRPFARRALAETKGQGLAFFRGEMRAVLA